MSINLISRHAAWEAITDTLYGLLVAAQAPSEELEDIETIIQGRRFRGDYRLPAVWIFRGPVLQRSGITTGMAETLSMDVSLTSFVQGDDPGVTEDLADEYASRAASVVIAQRAETGLSYVQDIVFSNMVFASPDESNQRIYSSTAVVEVQYRAFEGV